MLTGVWSWEIRTWVWENMGNCTCTIMDLGGRETHGGKTSWLVTVLSKQS